jgi:hypothetical protein
MVGGAPGEDVQTYLMNCPHISFVGVNSYSGAEWRADYSCGRESHASIAELREPLERYRVGRNLPAITEINSGVTPITSRLAYIAVGEFGVFPSRCLGGQRLFSRIKSALCVERWHTGQGRTHAAGYLCLSWQSAPTDFLLREPAYEVDQSKKTLDVNLSTPQAVLVSW